MGMLKELLGKKGLPKTPITFEETKKYNCEDYIIEPVEVEGKFKYYVQPIPKKEEKQAEQLSHAKIQKENFRKNITQGGKLQGIGSKVAIKSRIDRQQPMYGNGRENVKPKHYKTFEQEENSRY